MPKRIPTRHPLARYRKQINASLKDVEHATGISTASLSRIENFVQPATQGAISTLISFSKGSLSILDFFPQGLQQVDVAVTGDIASHPLDTGSFPHEIPARNIPSPPDGCYFEMPSETLTEMGEFARYGDMSESARISCESIIPDKNDSRLTELREQVEEIADLLKALDLIGDGIGGEQGYAVSAVALQAKTIAAGVVRSIQRLEGGSNG